VNFIDKSFAHIFERAFHRGRTSFDEVLFVLTDHVFEIFICGLAVVLLMKESFEEARSLLELAEVNNLGVQVVLFGSIRKFFNIFNFLINTRFVKDLLEVRESFEELGVLLQFSFDELAIRYLFSSTRREMTHPYGGQSHLLVGLLSEDLCDLLHIYY